MERKIIKMKKQYRNMISLMVAIFMLFSLSTVSFASNTSNGELSQEPQIIETSTYRMATTMDDQYSYTSTYTFATGTIAFVQTELATGEVVLSVDSADAKRVSARNTIITDEDTFLGYRYIYHGNDVWELRMPQSQFNSAGRAVDTYYIKIHRNTNTEKYVDKFRNAVDALDNSEKALLVEAGVGIVKEIASIIGMGLVTGPIGAAAAASIAGSVGIGGAMLITYEKYITDANNCYWAWDDAYKNCSWFG